MSRDEILSCQEFAVPLPHLDCLDVCTYWVFPSIFNFGFDFSVAEVHFPFLAIQYGGAL